MCICDWIVKESDLHTKRTGHDEFVDKTAESAKPIELEVSKKSDVDMVDAGDATASADQTEGLLITE